MALKQIPAPEFDLAMTLDSGQVFHWEKQGRDGFIGAIGNLPVYVEQRGQTLLAKVASASSRWTRDHGQDAHATIRHYFALDHRLADICASFPADATMNAARHFCRGLRVMRQPKWECLATFICSSMKQVAHIRQISKALRRRFGARRTIDGHVVCTFPPAGRISESSEAELRQCALGYRAKNLLGTARLVSAGEADLEGWASLADADLRARLCQLPGVGAKVANCVMLFAYERLRAFPIDVWIERVLKQQYFPRKKSMTVRQMREFCDRHFGEHGGYAQQYLFHYARTAARKSRVARDSSTPLPRSAPLRFAQGGKSVIRHSEGSARKDKEGARTVGGRRAAGATRLSDTTSQARPRSLSRSGG